MNILSSMHAEQNQKILIAFQLVLRPIIKVLLRYGIGYSEFVETVKTAFVDVASSDFGIRGRPTNISRVAVMTGLTRKEVRRIRTKIESGGSAVKVKTTPITEILTRWHTDEDFLNQQGQPKELQFTGTEYSFSELVKRYGGDVPPGAMRTELKRMNLVTEDENKKLKVLSRRLMPVDATERLTNSLVHGAYPLLATIAKNSTPELLRGEGYAQFSTYSQRIREPARRRLKRIAYDRLAEVAVSFDDLFTASELNDEVSRKQADQPVVMVGLYYFEETDNHAKYDW